MTSCKMESCVEKNKGIVQKFQSVKKEKLACAPKDYDFYGFLFSLAVLFISPLKCVAVHSYLN